MNGSARCSLTHTGEYYSVLKKKDVLTHGTTWMNLEDIMLSVTIQSQKDSVVQFHISDVRRVVTFRDKDVGRERNRELFFIGWRVFVWEDEKCPGDGCTTV